MPVRDPAFPPGSLHAPEGLFPVAFPRGPAPRTRPRPSGCRAGESRTGAAWGLR